MLSSENIDRINNLIESKLSEIERPFQDPDDREETRKDLQTLVDLLRANPKEKTFEIPTGV
jgi:hypothetical protein